MTPKQFRSLGILSVLFFLTLGIFFLLTALQSNIVYFLEPSEVIEKNRTDRFRLGGLVKKNSIRRNGINYEFSITDGKNSIKVKYSGIIPDLFNENQGVIAEGNLISNIFIADTILAKHDENYMPREITNSLKLKGFWRGKD